MKRLALCMFVVFSPSPLLALDKVGIDVGAGVTAPVAGPRETTTGFHVAGSIDYPTLSSRVHVRLDMLFSRTGSDFGEGRQYGDGRHTQTIGGTFGLSYLPLRGGMAQPYLTAGAGLHDIGVSWIPPSDPYPGAAPASMVTRHETKPGFAVGGGVNVGLGGVGLFVEGRYVRVFTENRSTSFVPVTVGVRFGGRR